MAVEVFTMDSLTTLDGGRLREAFEQALKRCRDDCNDRPGLKKERSVTIACHLTPRMDEMGKMESCDVQFQVHDSLPKRSSPKYNMAVGRGGLLFNELSPDDVRQRTLDEYVGPKGIVIDNKPQETTQEETEDVG